MFTKTSNNKLIKFSMVAVVSLVVLWFVVSSFSSDSSSSLQAREMIPNDISQRADLTPEEKGSIAIFRHNNPAVVYISTVKRVMNILTRDITEIPSGTGTGFIWDRQGHIITNYHVIQGNNSAKVRLNNKETYTARVVGKSKRHDIAVLKLDGVKNLPRPIQPGSSRSLIVGQKVFAIGNPFGLDHSLSTGIISALGRSIKNSTLDMDDLIQTDAAINPGNSGGPLLDSAGRLIGMNVAIYSPSGASAGIGFAIPVDNVNRVVPNLIKNGRYVRPHVGISANDTANKLLLKELGIKGLLVLEIERDSPADRAGLIDSKLVQGDLILGDVIQSVDGESIEDVNDFLDVIEKRQLNDTVMLEILRKGKVKLKVPMKLFML
jgi:S1-C subfamily serine protease